MNDYEFKDTQKFKVLDESYIDKALNDTNAELCQTMDLDDNTISRDNLEDQEASQNDKYRVKQSSQPYHHDAEDEQYYYYYTYDSDEEDDQNDNPEKFYSARSSTKKPEEKKQNYLEMVKCNEQEKLNNPDKNWDHNKNEILPIENMDYINEDKEFCKHYPLDSRINPYLGKCWFLFDKFGLIYLVMSPHRGLLNFLLLLFSILVAFMIFGVNDTEWWFKYIVLCAHLNYIKFLWNITTKNPGFACFSKNRASADVNYDTKSKWYCIKCKLIRWKGVAHCESCDMCVEDFHFHDDWSAKCYTKKNKNDYYYFVTSTIIYFALLLIMSTISLRGLIQPEDGR